MSEETEQIQSEMSTAPRRPKIRIGAKNGLSTGSTLLNLAISGNPHYGFFKGCCVLLVGDSSSGKTFLSLTCFAESTINRTFRRYRLIFDDVENGALMDYEYFFGKKMAEKLEAPAYDSSGQPLYSDTVESFYFTLDSLLDEVESGDSKPFIYVLDSENALSSDSEGEKFDKMKKAFEEGKDTAGIMSDGKAKVHSANYRRIVQRFKKNNCILIIISQTRDNLGIGFAKKTRSGGKALKFFSHLELWASVVGQLKKTVRKSLRQIGVETKIVVKKNRVAGANNEVVVPIYHSVGLDDVGSCVDYLVKEKHWKKSAKTIKAPDLGLDMVREKLIQHIEENDLEPQLREIVGTLWKTIEESSRVERKARY